MHFLPKITLIITGLSTLLFSTWDVVESAPNTNVTRVLCNGGVYAKGDPFGISLAYILTDLESITPSVQGYDYRNISPYPNAFAYGHAACNTNLTSPDCKICLGAAKTNMLSTCDSRIGARCELYDCQMRAGVNSRQKVDSPPGHESAIINQ